MISTSGVHLWACRRTQSTDATSESEVAQDVAALTADSRARLRADHQLAVRANSDDPAEQLACRRLIARHGDRLNDIMDEDGWPTAERVGEEAARAAWLSAHADRQLDIRRRVLQLMRQAVSAGSTDLREPAFLRRDLRLPRTSWCITIRITILSRPPMHDSADTEVLQTGQQLGDGYRRQVQAPPQAKGPATCRVLCTPKSGCEAHYVNGLVPGTSLENHDQEADGVQAVWPLLRHRGGAVASSG